MFPIESSSLPRIAWSLLLIATGIGGSILLWAPGSGSAAPAVDAESVGPATISALRSADPASAATQQTAPIITGPLEAMDLGDLAILRLRFPAGSRLGWHIHEDGPQLLMMEEGRGLMQERGGEIVELLPNQPVVTPGGVAHWHGAAPDEGGIQWNIYDGIGVEGSVTWLEPVTDEEYNAPTGR